MLFTLYLNLCYYIDIKLPQYYTLTIPTYNMKILFFLSISLPDYLFTDILVVLFHFLIHLFLFIFNSLILYLIFVSSFYLICSTYFLNRTIAWQFHFDLISNPRKTLHLYRSTLLSSRVLLFMKFEWHITYFIFFCFHFHFHFYTHLYFQFFCDIWILFCIFLFFTYFFYI